MHYCVIQKKYPRWSRIIFPKFVVIFTLLLVGIWILHNSVENILFDRQHCKNLYLKHLKKCYWNKKDRVVQCSLLVVGSVKVVAQNSPTTKSSIDTDETPIFLIQLYHYSSNSII